MEKKEKSLFSFQEHGDDEEIILIKKKKKSKKGKNKQTLLPPWVYRVGTVLLVAVLVLVWWFNRENLTVENISDWIQTRVVGMGIGDGYPVSIPGSESETGNFLSVDNEAVLVSNTALTAWNSTGKQTMSVQHSCSQPAVRQAGGRYLVYSIGGTSYQINTHTRSLIKDNTHEKILTGAIASEGRFALATQAEDYASHLTVYLADGSVQYEYDFGQAYITAVTLNSSGSRGAAAGIMAKDGAMISVVYIFDFNKEKPVYTITSEDNMVLAAQWGGDNVVAAIGDRKTLWVDTASGKAEEYSYNGQQLTAYTMDGSRVLLSVSSYSVSGACTVLEFRGSAKAVTTLTSSSTVKSLALYGETLAVLAGGAVNAYASATGEAVGSCDAGGDACAIALGNETNVYLLGVSEVRQAALE